MAAHPSGVVGKEPSAVIVERIQHRDQRDGTRIETTPPFSEGGTMITIEDIIRDSSGVEMLLRQARSVKPGCRKFNAIRKAMLNMLQCYVGYYASGWLKDDAVYWIARRELEKALAEDPRKAVQR
jgi:hypothetical protein